MNYYNGSPQFSIGAMALGRTGASTRTTAATGAEICAAAASATARNSPAAPALRSRCEAFRAQSVQAGNPDAAGETSIPRPALIAAGVVGVLALGFVAYTLTK